MERVVEESRRNVVGDVEGSSVGGHDLNVPAFQLACDGYVASTDFVDLFDEINADGSLKMASGQRERPRDPSRCRSRSAHHRRKTSLQFQASHIISRVRPLGIRYCRSQTRKASEVVQNQH
jgi:hypothetical protein